MDSLTRTIPDWVHAYSGKARDVYVPANAYAGSAPDTYLMVSSDRISAFDRVLPTKIPDKGKVVNQLSLWWFEQLADIVPGHVVSPDVPEEVAGRAVIVRRLHMFPFECSGRGYLAGTALREYGRTGAVGGVQLPEGLSIGSRLHTPVFTAKAKAVHVGERDREVSFEGMVAAIGDRNAEWLRRITLWIYSRASEIAAARGVLIADTKVEFGISVDAGERDIVLGDELITPDSSRFGLAEEWSEGVAPPAWDKQIVRDWLTEESGWDPRSGEVPPELPDEVVERTRARYIGIFERLTGRTWQD